MRVHPHVRSNLFHDRLPSSAALAPSALTRDPGGSSTMLSASTHYNLTMDSRSFHIV